MEIRGRIHRQLLMTLKELQNTGYLERKCWMAISAEYVVEEAMYLSHRLRYDDNNWATGWKVEIQFLSTAKRPDRLYVPLSSLSRAQEGHSVAVKRPGSDTVVCCPVL
jgi:hypothetical protein